LKSFDLVKNDSQKRRDERFGTVLADI